jgi:hypothetical protein
MIVRKLANAMIRQNWFTVLLEVLIVVVGIFIGLQVDGWNENRKDRSREIEYLQRIDAELRQDIAEFETGVTLAVRRRDYARLLMAALDDPELVRREPGEFLHALVRAGFTYSPTISDHTFEEIKSAGELGIIRDVELRVSITEYYRQVKQYEQWNYLRELSQTEYFKRSAGITTPEHFQASWAGDRRDGSEDEALIALRDLSDTPAFIQWLPIVAATLGDAHFNYRSGKETAETLREKISAALGKDLVKNAELPKG